METMRTEAIRKTVVVPLRPEAAFRLYTEEIGKWWPVQSHSVRGEDAATCVLEPEVGGRFYEIARDGTEYVWGTVTRWDPPNGITHTWHPGRDESTWQEVEVTFAPEARGTRVELVHTGWERYGERVDEALRNYETGWELVLGRYEATARDA